MKELSQITCCVVDHGSYLPLALKLSQTYKRVLYHTPWEKGYPTVNDCCLGDGFAEIERCDDFWPIKREIDLFVFPDILHAGLQAELRSQGFPVWGSGEGTSIETDRLKFLKVLQDTGLDLPQMTEIRGINRLRSHLAEREDKYIKISKYRGTMETKHWRDRLMDGPWLDSMAVKLGPLADLMRFLVCDAIPAEVEIGGDTYNIDGRWPSHMMEAYEWKDKSAFGAFKPSDQVADCIQQVMEAFGPVLGSHSYRNHFSMEIRVREDGRFNFIDPCCRGPLPMSWSQAEIYGNLGEIIAAGAEGTLVDPVPTAKFCCECILTAKSEKNSWSNLVIPNKLKPFVKVSACCQVPGMVACPPDGQHEDDVGWLVVTGDTPKTTLQKQLLLADNLPDGVHACTESLVGLLREIEEAEAMGMQFTKHTMPEPEAAAG